MAAERLVTTAAQVPAALPVLFVHAEVRCPGGGTMDGTHALSGRRRSKALRESNGAARVKRARPAGSAPQPPKLSLQVAWPQHARHWLARGAGSHRSAGGALGRRRRRRRRAAWAASRRLCLPTQQLLDVGRRSDPNERQNLLDFARFPAELALQSSQVQNISLCIFKAPPRATRSTMSAMSMSCSALLGPSRVLKGQQSTVGSGAPARPWRPQHAALRSTRHLGGAALQAARGSSRADSRGSRAALRVSALFEKFTVRPGMPGSRRNPQAVVWGALDHTGRRRRRLADRAPACLPAPSPPPPAAPRHRPRRSAASRASCWRRRRRGGWPRPRCGGRGAVT